MQRENHRLFHHSHSFPLVFYFSITKISKSFRQYLIVKKKKILNSISLKQLRLVEEPQIILQLLFLIPDISKMRIKKKKTMGKAI